MSLGSQSRMAKYSYLNSYVGRYLIDSGQLGLLKKYSVIWYNFAYSIGVVEKMLRDGSQSWELFEFITPDDGEIDFFIHPIREYFTEQRAWIAFVALTDL